MITAIKDNNLEFYIQYMSAPQLGVISLSRDDGEVSNATISIERCSVI